MNMRSSVSGVPAGLRERCHWTCLDSEESSGIFDFTKSKLELNPGGILLIENPSGQDKHSLVLLNIVPGALGLQQGRQTQALPAQN